MPFFLHPPLNLLHLRINLSKILLLSLDHPRLLILLKNQNLFSDLLRDDLKLLNYSNKHLLKNLLILAYTLHESKKKERAQKYRSNLPHFLYTNFLINCKSLYTNLSFLIKKPNNSLNLLSQTLLIYPSPYQNLNSFCSFFNTFRQIQIQISSLSLPILSPKYQKNTILSLTFIFIDLLCYKLKKEKMFLICCCKNHLNL